MWPDSVLLSLPAPPVYEHDHDCLCDEHFFVDANKIKENWAKFLAQVEKLFYQERPQNVNESSLYFVLKKIHPW